MEPFYSSDDEIAWGPVTVNEIKGDLLRPTRKVLTRRYTTGGKLNHSGSTTNPLVIQKPKMAEPVSTLAQEVEKLDISKESSEYFTPDSTVKDNFFIPSVDVPKNIDEPCVSSSYASPTAIADQTYLNFVEKNVTRKTNYNIHNIDHTLIDNTIIISSDDEETDRQHTPFMESVNVKAEAVNITLSSNESESDHNHSDYQLPIVHISPPSESKVHGDDVNRFDSGCCEEFISPIKKMQLFSFGKSSPVRTSSLILEPSMCPPESDISVQSDCSFSDSVVGNMEKALQNTYGLSKRSASLEYPNESQIRDDSEVNESLSSDKENSNIQRSISMESECGDIRDEYSFNDTIEEMARALQEGLDYDMPSDNKSRKVDTTPVQKVYPTCIPLAVNTAKLNTVVADTFKVPAKPLLSPLTTPNKYKHITSPIHTYIHGGSSPWLKQNVPAKTGSKLFTSRQVEKVPTDTLEFPKIVYKPSKQIVNEDKGTHLPANIQRLVKEPELTRHDAKIKVNTRVNENLSETNKSVNLTLLNNSVQDISLVSKRQTFKK